MTGMTQAVEPRTPSSSLQNASGTECVLPECVMAIRSGRRKSRPDPLTLALLTSDVEAGLKSVGVDD